MLWLWGFRAVKWHEVGTKLPDSSTPVLTVAYPPSSMEGPRSCKAIKRNPWGHQLCPRQQADPEGRLTVRKTVCQDSTSKGEVGGRRLSRSLQRGVNLMSGQATSRTGLPGGHSVTCTASKMLKYHLFHKTLSTLAL